MADSNRDTMPPVTSTSVTIGSGKTGMTFNPDDPRIDEGIVLFNQQDFFPCHDVFEDFWSEQTGPEKRFFQGLIHAAVCLFHFEGGNLTGARKMYSSFRLYVADFAPEFCGIDVRKLLDDMELCFEDLLAVSSGYPHGLMLKPELIPKIRRQGPG
ncbi:MAG: DUF309 domain-containing protein [Planctomycetaceae bacterium]